MHKDHCTSFADAGGCLRCGGTPKSSLVTWGPPNTLETRPGRTIYPLDTSVGTIGISGSLGSSAGGGGDGALTLKGPMKSNEIPIGPIGCSKFKHHLQW